MSLRISMIAAVLFVVAGTTLFSCKKDDDPETPSRASLIIGTWTINAYGQDDNMNGILETTEYDPYPAGANLVETFRADGTGTIAVTPTGGGATMTTNMLWSLQNNDQTLRVITGSDTSLATISVLSETEFSGYDSDASPRVIYKLTK